MEAQQANETITKIKKKKRSIVQYDAFDLCFISFIPMSQTIRVIDRGGACYFLHASK